MTSRIRTVKKRDGQIVSFEPKKITEAIYKAISSVYEGKEKEAERLSSLVINKLEDEINGDCPSVEDVQDKVELVLIEEGFSKAAKSYIIYRKQRSEIREAKRFFGVEDDLKLTINAARVLEKRYLVKDELGNVVETPGQMFRRISKVVAASDSKYDHGKISETEEKFYNNMANLDFMPNSPTLMNAGTHMGQLSACFVLPVGDAIKDIFETLKQMALIHQSGGGTGFSFSRVRPKGDLVRSTNGTASGPVSFMKVFDAASNVIKQGGRRRGANMAVLDVKHPDIIEFIRSKSNEDALSNFNISVAATDDFMKKVESGEHYDLVNPRSGKTVRTVLANDIFNLMVTMAWSTGDPGIVFIDEVNKYNPTPKIGYMESTNPCGEQPLLPYESCNLGSINLARFVNKDSIDWDRLREVVRDSVHFLDNIIDVNKYPLHHIKEMTLNNRKIGLGVMGFAEMLIQMKIPYDSNEALTLAEELMKFISDESHIKSIEIGMSRGSFPNFEESIWKTRGYTHMRNATTTTIAPTGSISIIAGCSSGIEPIFAVSFTRNVLEGTSLFEVNPLFERIAKERGFYSQDLMVEIAKKGSVQQIDSVPSDLKKIFATAMDISPEWHVKMQAACQKYVDNGVSKTVNLPFDASMDDVRDVFKLAYKNKCKGITVFRYGSKSNQVLRLGGSSSKEMSEQTEFVGASDEYAGGCPDLVCTSC